MEIISILLLTPRSPHCCFNRDRDLRLEVSVHNCSREIHSLYRGTKAFTMLARHSVLIPFAPYSFHSRFFRSTFCPAALRAAKSLLSLLRPATMSILSAVVSISIRVAAVFVTVQRTLFSGYSSSDVPEISSSPWSRAICSSPDRVMSCSVSDAISPSFS